SATNMLPVGIVVTSRVIGRRRVFVQRVAAAVDGHQHAKDRTPWLRFTFDNAAVVAHDLRSQRQAEATSGRLGSYKRVEQMRHQVVRHAGSVVAYAELERQ